jgi:N-methylhydantoinase A
VDTGGTFTDVVLRAGDAVLTHKLPSTPDDPAAAVLAGIAVVLQELRSGTVLGVAPGAQDLEPSVIHGSTVATNALLEGRGACVALVTTAGFEDTLHIARQNRPRLYAQVAARATPPLDRAWCIGLSERIDRDGNVVDELDETELRATLERLRGVEAVAVSLLHSYANPVHERMVARTIRARFPGLHLTVSSELLPEFREYERAATTVANAVVGPRMAAYVSRLDGELGGRLRIMSSAGGSLTARETCAQPVQTVLSGPAGGVVGALAAGRATGYDRLLTFDMGGTSTDVSLCDGSLTLTRQASIAGLPIRIPTLDIHTVGAGGGSVAWVDTGGALRVGPRSAGAVPGPACYGRGGVEATVTDANVVLGRLDPEAFLGGAMTLDAEAAHAAVTVLARRLEVSLLEAAAGVVRVAEATMARALKVISVERGHDARDFALLSFGGAGGLHAASLAEQLGVSTVIVPPNPGLLSAVGMHGAPAVFSQSRSVLRRLDPGGSLALPVEIADRALERLRSQGFGPDVTALRWTADLRYVGQSHEIEVPVTEGQSTAAAEAFHSAHEQQFGYRTNRAVELVAVRLRAEGARPQRRFTAVSGTVHTIVGTVPRSRLAWGAAGRGPALVTEYSSTTFVPTGWDVRVAEGGALVLTEEVTP